VKIIVSLTVQLPLSRKVSMEKEIFKKFNYSICFFVDMTLMESTVDRTL